MIETAQVHFDPANVVLLLLSIVVHCWILLSVEERVSCYCYTHVVCEGLLGLLRLLTNKLNCLNTLNNWVAYNLVPKTCVM